jgi:RND family efflux transporter MFP subunit
VLPAAAPVAVEIPDFPGVVTSRKSEIVPAEFQGRVERVQVSTGTRVRMGDPIAKLEDSEIRTEIENAKQNELAARADAGASGAQAFAAAQSCQRDTRLFRKGYVSKGQLQSSCATSGQYGSTTGAQLARAAGYKATRERLEAVLAKGQAVAPFDGIAMMVTVKEGEMAQKGTPLARIFDPSDLVMKFAVPKEYRGLVARGKRVELRIEGVERTIWATIEKIADEAPPITFSVVVADIDDSKLSPDEVRVTAKGRVRIAEAAAGGKR